MIRRGIIALMTLACASSGEVPLDTAFELGMSGSAVVSPSDLQVTFSDSRDSRCPRNVTCVWEGEAHVTLTVTEGSRSENVEIKVPGMATVLGHIIEVHELDPYPEDGPEASKAATKAQSVKLTVRRGAG